MFSNIKYEDIKELAKCGAVSTEQMDYFPISQFPAALALMRTLYKVSCVCVMCNFSAAMTAELVGFLIIGRANVR